MDMPKVRPVQIKTKGQYFLTRFGRWMFSIRKWEIVEEWEYRMFDGTTIIIPKGFVFDGASVPRIFWAILSPTGLLLVPSLIHDFGYRYDYIWERELNNTYKKSHRKLGQKYWDNVFRKENLRVSGMKSVAFFTWVGLRIYGHKAWKKNRRKNKRDLLPNGRYVI